MMKTWPACPAISGAPPAPGNRTFGFAYANDCRVDVGVTIDLSGPEKSDFHPASLKPVAKDLRHGDDGQRGVGELAVADRERQHVRLGADRSRFIDQHDLRRVSEPRKVRRGARKPNANEAYVFVLELT